MNKRDLKAAENAIRRIAERDGVPVAYVKNQMKLAMLHGMCSMDPKTRAYWESIPRAGEYPTPEEMITHTAGIIKSKKKQT